jgi:hypothetical protein
MDHDHDCQAHANELASLDDGVGKTRDLPGRQAANQEPEYDNRGGDTPGCRSHNQRRGERLEIEAPMGEGGEPALQDRDVRWQRQGGCVIR